MSSGWPPALGVGTGPAVLWNPRLEQWAGGEVLGGAERGLQSYTPSPGSPQWAEWGEEWGLAGLNFQAFLLGSEVILSAKVDSWQLRQGLGQGLGLSWG